MVAVPVCGRLDADQMRWRLEMAGMHALEARLHQQVVREQMVNGHSMVTDTTTQAKSIAYPTDTTLLDKGRLQLAQLIGQAKAAGVVVVRDCAAAPAPPIRWSWRLLSVATIGLNGLKRPIGSWRSWPST